VTFGVCVCVCHMCGRGEGKESVYVACDTCVKRSREWHILLVKLLVVMRQSQKPGNI
jgi:hypothetical protein